MEVSGDMLIGQFLVKLGAKGRIAFPKRFRQELGERIIVTYGFENSLMVVAEKDWKNLLSGTEDKPFLLSNARDTQRYLLGGAAVIELDSQGRMVIPEYLRRFASIKNDVAVIGLNKYIEIWDSAKWDTYRNSIQKNISEVAEKLIDRIDDDKK